MQFSIGTFSYQQKYNFTNFDQATLALALEAEKSGVTIEESTEVFDIKEAFLNGKAKRYMIDDSSFVCTRN